jgi:hypothetical protein
MSKFRKPLLWAVAGMVCISAGCRYISRQDDVEAKLALDIMKSMTIYDITSTNTPVTNLNQLSPWYPYVAHQKLSDFGKHAGFKTSIVENIPSSGHA